MSSPDGPDAVASTICDPSKKFGAPVAVEGLLVPNVRLTEMRLSPDELTAYLTGYANGTWDMYMARRTSRTGAFETPTPMTAQNSPMFDFGPAVSADGLTLWFGSNRSGQIRIWVATRPSTLADFGVPGLASGVNSTGDEDGQPFVTVDGAEMWFSSTRAPNPNPPTRDIWVATWSGSVFANPVHVVQLSSAGQDWMPLLSDDRLTLYFMSDRGGPGTKGAFDIFTSHRATVNAPFPPPTLVDELNTAGEDGASWLSPDGCRLYFNNLSGIFVATRQP